ncbi:MAG: hypothetical protein ACRDOM_08340 [Nocardioides sp.]
MTWNSFHRRGEVLRDVTATADVRRDGLLPMDVPGVAETFADELALLGALQLRWHTRLSGRIERALMNQPMNLEQAVITAWQGTADELPGIHAIVDHYRSAPTDATMAEAMAKSAAKERILLAVMAGRSSAHDAQAARVGQQIERRARRSHRQAVTSPPARGAHRDANAGLLDKIKAALVA